MQVMVGTGSNVEQVESIAWDIDYKSKIKRSEFERACLDLKPRFARPIMDALDDANLTLVSPQQLWIYTVFLNML